MRCACGQKNPPEARFCMACGRALGVLLPAERPFVSVVFFDLVGSSQRFREGLEAAYQALQGALEEAARIAREHRGFVHRFLGDGVLVLFGAPRARGREPWRALEAALGMVWASPLPARVGVASGEVLWTPLGDGQAGNPTALGPPVVLAERLSKLGRPGEVLTDRLTLELARGLGPVEAYRLLEVRLEPDPEGEALLARLRQALSTPPARLNLVGPPGSGKSLLLDRFLEDPPFPAVVLERMGPETPLRVALLEAVEKAFGSPEVLLAQAGLPPKLETAWRYSLGLLPRPSWSREALEGAILEAWRRVLLSLKAPLLLVLKDLHAPDLTLERLLLHPFPNLLLLLESRRPLFSPHLGLKRGEAPLLLALQPALDALPSRERQALLAWGVLGEVPEEALTGLVGAFSRERLFREGLLEGNQPLKEVGEAALRLVPAETQRAWHLEAARLYQKRGQLLPMARHLHRAGEGRQAALTLRLLAQKAWREGHPEEAIPLYHEALRADPALEEALKPELQDALASLGLALEAEAGPRREDPVLTAFREAKDPLDLLPLLPGLRPYPLEEAKARLQAAGALWRRFQPLKALEVLTPFPPQAPKSLLLHRRSLEAGLLMDLGRHAEAEALLLEAEPGDLEAQVRHQATRIRLLLETGGDGPPPGGPGRGRGRLPEGPPPLAGGGFAHRLGGEGPLPRRPLPGGPQAQGRPGPGPPGHGPPPLASGRKPHEPPQGSPEGGPAACQPLRPPPDPHLPGPLPLAPGPQKGPGPLPAPPLPDPPHRLRRAPGGGQAPEGPAPPRGRGKGGPPPGIHPLVALHPRLEGGLGGGRRMGRPSGVRYAGKVGPQTLA